MSNKQSYNLTFYYEIYFSFFFVAAAAVDFDVHILVLGYACAKIMKITSKQLRLNTSTVTNLM